MQIIEGTWEEIKQHDEELAGKQVTVIVAEAGSATNLEGTCKPGRFDKYIGAISSGRVHGHNAEAEFARIMDEKAASDLARRKIG